MTHRLFISYSHNDKRRLERLHKHLAQLQREGSVAAWYDREISAGGNIDHEITTELAAADIFVAALSPDFIASSYCIDVELEHALERELSGELTIVPVIFEPCDWLNTKLGKFKAIPDDGKPVSEFTNENVAFLTVVNELRKLVSRPKIGSKKSLHIETSSKTDAIEVSPTNRYRVKKDFDALHKRDFVEKSFKEIFEFFRSSIAEISLVNEIEARLSDLGNDHFSCTIINRGMLRKYETLHVRMGGLMSEISILYGDENKSNSSNGGFFVRAGEYELGFSASLFGYGNEKETLSAKDVAQKLWDDLLSHVGVDYD